MTESILRRRPDLDATRLERTRELMCKTVPDCIVTGFEHLINYISLPDGNDRHVVAAAIHANAQTIVTFNLDDFPEKELDSYGIEAQHPDDFLVGLINLSPASVVTAFIEQVADLRQPIQTRQAILDRLHQIGLIRTANNISSLIY